MASAIQHDYIEDMREVAPGVYAPGSPALPSASILADWVRVPGTPDHYRLRPQSRYLRLDSRTSSIIGVSADTIKRLAYADFVVLIQPSPGVYLLDVDSWIAHLDTCSDPDIWDPDGEPRERYRFRNAIGGYQG